LTGSKLERRDLHMTCEDLADRIYEVPGRRCFPHPLGKTVVSIEQVVPDEPHEGYDLNLENAWKLLMWVSALGEG